MHTVKILALFFILVTVTARGKERRKAGNNRNNERSWLEKASLESNYLCFEIEDHCLRNIDVNQLPNRCPEQEYLGYSDDHHEILPERVQEQVMSCFNAGGSFEKFAENMGRIIGQIYHSIQESLSQVHETYGTGEELFRRKKAPK